MPCVAPLHSRIYAQLAIAIYYADGAYYTCNKLDIARPGTEHFFHLLRSRRRP